MATPGEEKQPRVTRSDDPHFISVSSVVYKEVLKKSQK